MNKKRLPFIVLAVLIILVGGFLIYKKQTSLSNKSPAEVKALAWNVFDGYLASAKDHDLKDLETYSYRLSDVCRNSASSSDCDARMDYAYSIGSQFKQSDFTNAWYDNKQIVLSTDWQYDTNDVAAGEIREAIYFVRASDGKIKVLFFTQPKEIVYRLSIDKLPPAELKSDLEAMILDSDYDGLADQVETCSYPGAVASSTEKTASSTPNCLPTDPHKRDTDGNGWWDSIEQYLK